MPSTPNIIRTGSPKKYSQSYDSFLGIDLSSAVIGEKRSPNALNIMPGLKGNPTKRTGYELICSLSGRINGQGAGLFHAGTTLYKGETQIMTGLADNFSSFETMEAAGTKYTYVFDGKRAVVHSANGSTEYTGWADTAGPGYEPYIPTLLIGKNPNAENLEAGGTAYEDLNLCSRRWKELFCVKTATATATGFSMAFDGLASDAVKAWILQANGSWQEKTENTDFTVNRTTGVITFSTAPGVSPSEGVDNVKIEAAKDFFAAYTENPLNSLKIATMYGLSDVPDRIFATDGSASDRWCYYKDPTYWGETWYSDLSGAGGGIIGYSLLQGYLATHMSNGQEGRAIVLRNGTTLSDGRASFSIIGAKQGEEAFAPRGFAFLSEPLFLTRRGVYAFTPADITGERYSQVRSFYINKELTALSNLQDAYACAWRDFYVLSAGGHIYLLDGSQKYYSRYEPQSTYQYECYKWDGVPARIIWSQKDTVGGIEIERLYFGDTDGHIFRFYWDTDALESYHDWDGAGGKAIECYWEFADFLGKAFWENKSVKYVAVRMAPYVRTSIEIINEKKGQQSQVLYENAKTRYLSWANIKWSAWTWSSDESAKTIGTKIKLKKMDKARFRVRNNGFDEPFGLYGFGFEYTEQGSKYKG